MTEYTDTKLTMSNEHIRIRVQFRDFLKVLRTA